MEFGEVMAKRRSVRAYKPRSIGQRKLRKLQRALQIAPSGGNRQDYRFIFVTDERKRKRIAEQAGHQEFIGQAPVLMVAVCEPGGEFNVAIAVDHMILAATDIGLGTCWIGWFEEAPVRKALRIPKSKAVPIMVTVGYAAEEPGPRPRKPLKDLIALDSYGKASS